MPSQDSRQKQQQLRSQALTLITQACEQNGEHEGLFERAGINAHQSGCRARAIPNSALVPKDMRMRPASAALANSCKHTLVMHTASKT